jgi:hypothetical protein
MLTVNMMHLEGWNNEYESLKCIWPSIASPQCSAHSHDTTDYCQNTHGYRQCLSGSGSLVNSSTVLVQPAIKVDRTCPLRMIFGITFMLYSMPQGAPSVLEVPFMGMSAILASTTF